MDFECCIQAGTSQVYVFYILKPQLNQDSTVLIQSSLVRLEWEKKLLFHWLAGITGHLNQLTVTGKTDLTMSQWIGLDFYYILLHYVSLNTMLTLKELWVAVIIPPLHTEAMLKWSDYTFKKWGTYGM